MRSDLGDIKQNSNAIETRPLFTNSNGFKQSINCSFDDLFKALPYVEDEEEKVEIITLWLEKSKGAVALKEEGRLEEFGNYLYGESSELFGAYKSILMGSAIGRFAIECNLNAGNLSEINSGYVEKYKINPKFALGFWLKNVERDVSLDEINTLIMEGNYDKPVVRTHLFKEWFSNPFNSISFEELNLTDPPKFINGSFYQNFFQKDQNNTLLDVDKDELKRRFVSGAKNKYIKIAAVISWLKRPSHSFDFDFLEREIFPEFEDIVSRQSLVYEWFECKSIESETKYKKLLELIKSDPDLIYITDDDVESNNEIMVDFFRHLRFSPEQASEFCGVCYPDSEFQRAGIFYKFVKEGIIKKKEVVKDFIKNLENRLVALDLFYNINSEFSGVLQFDKNDLQEMVSSQRAYLLESDVELAALQTRDLISLRVIGDYLKPRILPIPPLLENIDEYQFGESVVLGIDREEKLQKFKELMEKENITDKEAVDFFEQTLCLGEGAIDINKIDPLGLNGHRRAGNLLRNNKSEIAFLLAQDDADLFIGSLGEIDGGCGANIGTHTQTSVDLKLTQNIFDQVLLSTFQQELALPILTQHGDRLGSHPKGAKTFGNQNIDSSFIKPEMLLRIVKERFFGNGKLKGNPWDVIRCGLDEDEVLALSEKVLTGESYNSDASDIAVYMVLQKTIPEVLRDKCFENLNGKYEQFIAQAQEIVKKEQEHFKEDEEAKLMKLEDIDAPKQTSNRANSFRQKITNTSTQNAAASKFVTNILGKFSGSNQHH
jgi:hypothetical protein